MLRGEARPRIASREPVPGAAGETRPIVQTGQYGENIGQIQLSVTEGEEDGGATFDVTSYETALVPRVAIPDEDAANADELNKALDDELANTYPRVAEVRTQYPRLARRFTLSIWFKAQLPR